MTADIFANLDALRLSPDNASLVGAKEVLTRVPVRKPNRHEFFRSHPDSDMTLSTAVFEDKAEGEIYLVHPDMWTELAGEMKPALLTTVITRQGLLFLWPVKLPDDSGRRDDWSASAREAYEMFRTLWVRMSSDKSHGSIGFMKRRASIPSQTGRASPFRN